MLAVEGSPLSSSFHGKNCSCYAYFYACKISGEWLTKYFIVQAQVRYLKEKKKENFSEEEVCILWLKGVPKTNEKLESRSATEELIVSKICERSWVYNKSN